MIESGSQRNPTYLLLVQPLQRVTSKGLVNLKKSASIGQPSGVALPITFQGVGITRSYQRQAGSSIGVKLAVYYSFEKLTSREPSHCELELRLTS